MTHKVDYQLTKDKRGRKIAYKVDVATGKKERVKYKVAQKRRRDLVYRRRIQAEEKVIKGEIEDSGLDIKVKEYRSIVKELERKEGGATFKGYAKSYKVVDAEIRKKYGGEGQKKLPSESTIKSRVKKTVFDHRSGAMCRYRYGWVYWQKLGTDKEGKEVCDSTPVFEAGSLERNIDLRNVKWGSKTNPTDYETMIEVCMDIYKPIMAGVKSGDICNRGECKVQGGLCVLLYNKLTKNTIKNSPHRGQFERGEGCGFSFDFKKFEKERV